MNQRRNLQTGQYIAGCRTHGSYVRVERDDSLWCVFVGVPTMTQADLDRFRSGEIRFAAVRIDESLFFLFRFGEANWLAAPFEPRACASDLPGDDGTMRFVFVDSDSGVAQEIRAARLSPELSDRIRRNCEALSALPYDRAESLKRQAAVLRRFPSAEDMLQASDSPFIYQL